MRRWAVVQFPGSNCDYDALKVFQRLEGVDARFHWYEDPIPKNAYEVIALPGGFSFGDYLRAGAIAKTSAAVRSLSEAIEAGAHVLGICNGFQILLESQLLPGFLQVNQSLRFVSETVELEIAEEAFPWFGKKDIGKKVRYPIAHRFGNYQTSPMDQMQPLAALRYSDNPNGSFQNIAGIYRKLGSGSIFGLMPHPERAAHEAIRLTDGAEMFQYAYKGLRS